MLRMGRSLNHFIVLSCNNDINILDIIVSFEYACKRVDAIECLKEITWAIGSLVPRYDMHRGVTNFRGSIDVSILPLK